MTDRFILSTQGWRGRRVFVTGHTGFKGGWLSLWLHEIGARVFGYALPPASAPNLFSVAGIGDIVEGTMADVRQFSSLREALCRSKADVVFHLAAQPLVWRGYTDPLETYSTNVMGTAHLLEAARECETVRAVVVVTSDKCYEEREPTSGYQEGDRLGGDDPYSSSKACVELLTHAYRQAFTGPNKRELRIATARTGNVIGGGDWAENRLIPDALRAFGTGRVLTLRQPDSVRPWQHVLEPLRGYIILAERLLDGNMDAIGSFNFGPDLRSTVSVREVVDTLMTLWSNETKCRYRVATAPQPHESQFLSLDSTKATTVLNWRPLLGLPAALNLTVDWYRAHRNGADMRRFTREQLSTYMPP